MFETSSMPTSTQVNIAANVSVTKIQRHYDAETKRELEFLYFEPRNMWFGVDQHQNPVRGLGSESEILCWSYLEDLDAEIEKLLSNAFGLKLNPPSLVLQ